MISLINSVYISNCTHFKKWLLTLVFLSLSSLSFGSDYFWVGGSGDWTDINHWAQTSGGIVKHIQTPTPDDNIILDQNSFSVNGQFLNLNLSTAQFKNFDATNLVNNINLSGVCTLFKIYGGLKFSTKINIPQNIKFEFEANSAGNQIWSNGFVFSSMEFTFKGTNAAEWLIMDDFVLSKTLSLEQGKLKFQTANADIERFKSNSTSLRSVFLGNTKIKLLSWEAIGANFSLDAGTSKITVKVYSAIHHSSNGSATFYDVDFLAGGSITNASSTFTFHDVNLFGNTAVSNSCTFNKLFLAKGQVFTFEQNTTQNFITSLSAIGDCVSKIRIQCNAGFTNFSKIGGNVTISGCELTNIHAIGGASFTATSSFDLGGSTGWIIPNQTSRTLYWVGSSGEWNDTAHWSNSTGGPGGQCIPTLLDDVVFDNKSFASKGERVKILDKAFCHDITVQTDSFPDITSASSVIFTISGSLSFCPKMQTELFALIKFVSSQNGETIKTSNHIFDCTVSFEGNGGWTLLDSFLLPNAILEHLNGKLNTNDKYVSAYEFKSSSTTVRQLILGSSILDINEGGVSVSQYNLNLNAGSSVFRMFGDYPLFNTYSFPVVQFNVVIFTNLVKEGHLKCNATRFRKVQFECDGNLENYSNMDTLEFKAGHQYVIYGRDTINSVFKADGTCNKQITIQTEYPFQLAYLCKPTGSFNVSYCNIRSIYAQTPVQSTASFSGNLGNNIGWNFSLNSNTLYWIGGTGDWQDPIHWSLSSGGPPVFCIPNPQTNVVFDVNSFLTSNDTVYFGDINIFHKDMTWAPSITQNPVFINSKEKTQFVLGSLSFIPGMNYTQNGRTNFYGTFAQKSIKMSGQFFNSLVVFADSCVWNILDTFEVKDQIRLHKGVINANANCIKANDFIAEDNLWKKLDLTNSTLQLLNYSFPISVFHWKTFSNTTLIATTSKLLFNNSHMNLEATGTLPLYFGYVEFGELGGGKIDGDVNQQFFVRKALFKYNGGLYSETHFDTLLMTKGSIYHFEPFIHQYVNNVWEANGNCYQPITMYSSNSSNNQAVVHKVNGNVALNYINIKNLKAIGGSNFVVNNGNDLGNNTNWNINPISGIQLYWVNGNGDWNDSAHWSYTSGGASGACIPTFRDDVHFDNNSFIYQTDSVGIISSAECRNMIWTATNSAPRFISLVSNNISIFGSLAFQQNMEVDIENIRFLGNDTARTILTHGHDIKSCTFDSYGGWKVLDTLFASESIMHNMGFVDFGSSYIKTAHFSSFQNKKKKLQLGTSNWNINSTVSIATDSLIFDAGTSRITFPMDSLKMQNQDFVFQGSKPIVLNKVEFLQYRKGLSSIKNSDATHHYFKYLSINNDAIFLGEYSFDSLLFTAGNTYKLEHSKTQTINTFWYIRGNNCFPVNLESTLKNFNATVSMINGVVSGDFINIRDNYAVGGASFFAGFFSTNIQNNQGWNFVNGPQYVYGLGPDTSFQIGSSVTISTANFNGGPTTTYLWSNGSTSSTITVNKVGVYIVTVSYELGCTVIDTIEIGCAIYPNYQVTLPHCYGDSNGTIQVIIPASTYTYTYLWANGQTTSLLQNVASGNHSLLISVDTLCFLNDTVWLDQPPPVLIPLDDTSYCEQDSVFLNPGNQFFNYNWSDGYTGKSRWINAVGQIILSVQDTAGCWSEPDTINITEDPKFSFTLGADTSLCFGESKMLIPDLIFDNYFWSNGAISPSITAYSIGVYWLDVNQKACKYRDSLVLKLCDSKLDFPNVFTPNGDGVNDFFEPNEIKNISKFELKVYNRWGTLLLKTTDTQMRWDGTINGSLAAEGVYFWVLDYAEFDGFENGATKTQQGNVTLLRE